MIYTYRISLKLIFTVILKKRSIQKVVFISDAPSMNTYSRIKIFFIKFFIRLPFENITFRIADFVDSQRSTLHFQVLEESRDHALRFANEEIENLGLLYYFPIWLTKNLTLHLSQIYYQSIYIAVREILLFNAIDRTDKDILYIEVDRCIKSYLCEQNFNGIVIKNRSEYYYFFIRDVFFFLF